MNSSDHDGYDQQYIATHADGRKVDFSDHLMLNSFNRTVLVRQERIDGPQLGMA